MVRGVGGFLVSSSGLMHLEVLCGVCLRALCSFEVGVCMWGRGSVGGGTVGEWNVCPALHATQLASTPLPVLAGFIFSHSKTMKQNAGWGLLYGAQPTQHIP